MHELAMTKSILQKTLDYAERTEATQVETVILKLGVLRDLKAEWLQRYFAYISRGTIAEQAELLIETVPVSCRCENCGKVFPVDVHEIAVEDIRCPECESKKYRLHSGNEFMLLGIEVR